jgi:pimeloyl-ACP methyl ester carboxylesterase
MTDSTLVLVPGLLCDNDLFAAQRDALAADGLDVVVADVTQQDSIGAMADAVLSAATGRLHLLGLSMGGYVALEVARRAPERLAGLALLDTSARPDTAEQTARRRALLETARDDGLDAALEALWPLVVAPSRVGDAALHRRFADMGRRLGPDVFARQEAAIIGRADTRPHLAALDVPTLVLCGRDDALTPVEVHVEMAAALPSARLVIEPHCGHLSTWEKRDVVTTQLRTWLAQPPGG